MTITCPRCQCVIQLLTGEPLNLTLMEHRLLVAFRERPLQFISREDLLAYVWDWPMTTAGLATTRTVDTHIYRLRHKLADAGYPDLIESIRGRGWRLKVPTEAREAGKQVA